jgi:hypothetical protein
MTIANLFVLNNLKFKEFFVSVTKQFGQRCKTLYPTNHNT